MSRARIATAPRFPLRTAAFRYQAPQYDPRSGEGARLHGGRFNPAKSFAALYLCETRPCAVAELARLGSRHLVGIEGLLPRSLFRYEPNLQRVLDLTRFEVRDYVGVSSDDLTGPDWALCQEIGTEAHARGDQAIRTPSATGIDHILVVFPELLGEGLLHVDLIERWDKRGDQ